MQGSKRNIVVLGSTGSIGTQTLDVVRRNPEKLAVVGLSVNTRIQDMLAQAAEFGVSHVVAAKEPADSVQRGQWADEAAKIVGSDGPCEVAYGSDALLDLCRMPEADIVVNALVGAAGLRASY